MKNAIAIEAGWLPKDKAAERLGVGVRQLENRAAKGEIRKNPLPRLRNERAARVLYSIEDIDAIKAGKPNFYGETKPEPAPAAPAAAVALTAADPFAGLAAQLAGLARAFPPAAEAKRRWLTLDEAEEVSGLTRRWLIDQAENNGSSPVAVRDMGKHARGGRWRFDRECL